MRVVDEEQYRATLARIEGLMDALPDSEEGRELQELVAAVEAYEEEHFPVRDC